ncbi:MAG TPA: sialate O-acetylesterase [Firmicutes bacterium]|nr:sialate O-acetylesterase [Bacillota bacterium]
MKFCLAPVFGDGMVVQRNQPIRIYGQAEEALRLQVDFDGVHAAPAVSKGRFAFLLPPHRAGTGLTLRIAGGGEELTIRDIACGEVWIAGGQSNMAMDLSGTAEYEQDPDIPACEEIRFYTVGRNSLCCPAEYGEGYGWAYAADSGWLRCGPDSAPHFSAVGYHFARKLHEDLKVPVGVISCNVGGSNMFSWLPRRAIEENPAIARFADFPPDGRPEEELLAEYQAYMKGWLEGRDSLANVSGTAEELPCVYYEWNNRYSYKRPSCLYNAMLSKVSRYTAKGVIWYQGESEAMDGYAAVYLTTLETLVETFRRDQGNPGLAFAMVQLAPWNCPEVRDWEAVCDQQRRFSLRHPRYGMVTIGDCGGDDIHPAAKGPVGQRLALAVRNKAYGHGCEYSGPVAAEARQYGQVLTVRFTHSEGLYAPEGRPAFCIRYDDGTAEEAGCLIEGDCIHLSCAPGKRALYVEYEYRIDADIGLYNAQRLPASLFRLEVNARSEDF